MKAIIFYILLNAVRNKLYIGLILFLLIAISLSIFLGSTAFIEEQQFTNAYIAGLSRIIIESGMMIFVCINIGKAFENKEIEFIISKSISREKFILSSIAGFLLASILIIIPLILLILIIFLYCVDIYQKDFLKIEDDLIYTYHHMLYILL